jgi:hypothetical protein
MHTAQFGLDGQEKCHQDAQTATVLHSYEYSPSEAKFPHSDVAYPLSSYLTSGLPRILLQNNLQSIKTVRYVVALFHTALASCKTTKFTLTMVRL